jgi:small subunit ribosomal protein S5
MNYGQRSNRGGPRGGPRGNRGKPQDEVAPEFSEKVGFINRCSKVVKGGRRFSFSSLVVTGDMKGRVGVGYGKANQVPEAIRKGAEQARKNMAPIRLRGDTIPHEVIGRADGGRVLLRPATTGTGVIAGGGVRAVLEAAGVKNVLSKSLGSNNHIAVVQATLDGLLQLKLAEDFKKVRGSAA